jgi:hypothetical protein
MLDFGGSAPQLMASITFQGQIDSASHEVISISIGSTAAAAAAVAVADAAKESFLIALHANFMEISPFG